ncbi:MAG: polysaccharide biosynthesis protein PslF [Pseudonocardiales bacterium]|jgi:glycosyltransferase involved in cell wall biosynthesis|nr:polysaccharide biosynthesis protein PslF [Pseudonocardiales bacterium]
MTTRFGFVSTYPPTRCGLASFTASLRDALIRPGTDTGVVVRLVDAPAPRPAPEVVAQVVRGDHEALQKAVAHLNACDVVVVQHEYDVYGGRDGEDILLLLDGLSVPSIVVLHTVLTTPTPHQREVLEAVVAKADGVVAMTQTAHDLLASGYDVDLGKIRLIPHGARDMTAPVHSTMFRTGQFTALTWGLLSPGKGVEWAIDAMALLGNQPRAPRYIIAGPTQPAVLATDGEAYRDGLLAQVSRLGLQSSVTFDGQFRDPASLAQLVRSADVVVLPYDSTEQVTSSVLVEAVAAGKPVIATEFPHARDLLARGAGLLVPHRDPEAVAAALRTLITRGDLAATMAIAAAAEAPQLRWPAVAEQYRALASLLIVATVAA